MNPKQTICMTTDEVLRPPLSSHLLQSLLIILQGIDLEVRALEGGRILLDVAETSLWPAREDIALPSTAKLNYNHGSF